MRKVKRKISRNLKWIIVGLILMGIFVKIAYVERGYVAYGGEWLTLPIVLMAVDISRYVRDVRHLFGTEGGYGSDED